MHWARRMAVAGALFAGVAGVPAALAAPASAGPQDCKTAVVTTVNRPDNGHGSGGVGKAGYWADMALKRTTVVCLTGPAEEKGQALYTATVTEVGTLVTRAGEKLSPNNGEKLVGGVKGKVEGGWKADLVAPAAWGGWVPNFDGKTLSCATDVPCEWTEKKDTWGQQVYGQAATTVKGKGTYAWGWKYWICADTFAQARTASRLGWWWDTDSTNDGTNDAPGAFYAGDILGGRTCPTPSASTSTSPSASPSVSTTPVGNEDDNEALPITGGPVTKLAAAGLIILAVGAGLALVAKRRRTRFVA